MSLLMSAAARGNAANGADSDLLGGYQKPDWLRKMASPSIQHVKGLPRKSSPINSAAAWMDTHSLIGGPQSYAIPNRRDGYSARKEWQLGIKP